MSQLTTLPPRNKKRKSSTAVPKSSCITDLRSSRAQSSSGIHSASAVSLLLVDEDNFCRALIENDLVLVDKTRKPVDSAEKKYIAESQNVDFLIEVEEISTKASTWKITNLKPTTDTSWNSTTPVSTCLLSHHRAVQTTLRRFTLGSAQQEEFTVILIKTIKGKSSGAPDLIFGVQDRQKFAFALFDLLLDSRPTTLVMGNLGFSPSSVLRHAMEYERDHRKELVENVRVLATDQQDLCCLYLQDLESDYRVFIGSSLPSRYLFVEVQTNTTSDPGGKEQLKDTSNGSHSAGKD